MSAYVGLFVGLHYQIAKLTDCPELQISQDDGKAFLNAVQNVSRHYPITATQKAIDWSALIITTGLIYTPRVVAVRQRAMRQHNHPPPGPLPGAQVYAFDGPRQMAEPPSDPPLEGLH